MSSPYSSRVDGSIVQDILLHLMDIMRGDCKVTDAMVESEEDPGMQEILVGIQYLNEDLIHKAAVAKDAIQKLEDNAIELQKAKEKAESASKAKSDFLSLMSHEIRTPMNAVVGLAHILMEESPRPDQLEHLESLSFSAQNLLSLLNDILDFHKMEAGKISLEEIPFDLLDLCNNLIKSFTALADAKGIGLKLDLQVADDEKWIIGDPTRLFQILSNLVGNAIKFTTQGSVTVSIHKRKDLWEFKVIDTGIGIAADKVKLVFERYSQAESNTTRKFGGTGLGLAIVKRLVELMDSQIQLESELGKGSIFSFGLNLKTVAPGEVPKKLSISDLNEHGRLTGVQVLIVEDNALNVKVVSRFLQKWGVEFQVAQNGQEAVEVIEIQQFDVVLMDLHMPVMDGLAATQKVRSLQGEYYQQLPILALSATTVSEMRETAGDDLFSGYLSKPFKPIELFQAIELHAGRAK
ncbi:ATP-binding protein [Pontibacter sp. G13]|uniref:ATP-binding protein n=1 Tax=Pontibacter sp. G13 TaxID=3074898 RepID=UPI002889B1D8|nr:ATP-binding protein [Pontibacter sp. G13]WNJ17255.1 ATP-binding protein [Pontibacter sp. G13]